MARAIRKEPTKAQKIAPIQFSWYICNLNKKKSRWCDSTTDKAPNTFFRFCLVHPPRWHQPYHKNIWHILDGELLLSAKGAYKCN